MKLASSVLEVATLRPDDRADMFRLMQRNYENVRRQQFESDLAAKRWVIVVRSSSHRLVGFSTQVVLDARVGSDCACALYSGDTVVDREYWGDPALAHAWGNFALELIDQHPADRLFWFLTSKGFRTYRYLPLFFSSYFPHFQLPTPLREKRLLDAFGRQVANGNYDSDRGVICAPANKDFVRPDLGEPGFRSSTDPNVRFFVERNPGFRRGDELCCLAPLTRDNFTRAAYRVIRCQSRPAHCV
jgi:hypothetical protein